MAASHFMMSAVASQLVLSCLFSILAAASAAVTPPPPPPPPPSMEASEMGNAVNEMQMAGYNSFAMLVNMVQDRGAMRGHVTFLVPSDEALSETPPAEGRVLEFLQVHSIPAPLAYEDLRRLPDGTSIPTNRTGYAVTISSAGAGAGGNKLVGGLFLNGVELVHANVCVDGNSIRCHGINGVLSETGGNSSKCPSNCHAPEPATDSPDSPVNNNGHRGRAGGNLLMYEDLLAAITVLLITVLLAILMS